MIPSTAATSIHKIGETFLNLSIRKVKAKKIKTSIILIDHFAMQTLSIARSA